ncbi:MAG TPA: pitrilysin family protein [Hyphomicrobiales bacterium]|nr:pitrilysin family protein [Hyphomicrobiales bacterium]
MAAMRAFKHAGFLAGLLVLLILSAARPLHATEIQRVVSPGGIEAWLVEEHTLPLVSMHFAFRGGAAQDPAGREGLANMVTGLLDEGAGDLDSEAFQARLEDLAIRLYFDAGRDALYGELKTLSRHRDEAFDLLRLALTAPRFDAAPVERIRAQILTNLRFEQEDPGDVAGKAWFEIAFGAHPYARPVNGNPQSVAAIAPEDLRRYVSRVFARDKLKIAVVGDIDAKTLGRKLDEIFGALPAASDLDEVAKTDVAEGPVRRIIDMDIPQTVIRFGQQGIARKDPDFVPAYVVNYILGGGGFSSRLYEEVREKRGLAYSVFTYLYPLDSAALLLGGVATQNDRAAESLATIEAELKRLAEEGPSAEELEAAKSYLKGSYALRFDTSDKIAGQLVAIQLEELGIDYINTRNDLIEAVTIDDVKRVARRLIAPEKLIVTVVGRPKGLEEIRPDG